MSLISLSATNIETFSLTLHPSRSFASSSSGGVQGNLGLVSRPSRSVKDVRFVSDATGYVEGGRNDKEIILKQFSTQFAEDRRNGSTETNYISFFTSSVGDYATWRGTGYLDRVSATTQSIKNTVTQSIVRITPSYRFNTYAINGVSYEVMKDNRKEIVLNNLFPAYSTRPGQYTFDYANYNAVNFFTASSVPEQTTLIYPGNTGSCVVDRAFTLNFFINPRYTTETKSSPFRAGTIFHVSSSIAVSLVTGSLLDPAGFPSSYRIMLQLSHSADVSPDSINLSSASRTYPQDLVFISDDQQITRNTWNFVSIRWGSLYNAQSGSIQVNGQTTSFAIPSSSLKNSGSPPSGQIFLGNYYSGPSDTEKFFNSTVSFQQGVAELDAGSSDPSGFAFTNPLNAEIHTVKFFSRFLSNSEVVGERTGINADSSRLSFCLPVEFMGGINATPSRRIPTDLAGSFTTTYTSTPFNKFLSGRAGGRLINVTNFLRDASSAEFPRLYDAFVQSFGHSSSSSDANSYICTDAKATRNNLMIVPCDDGNYRPQFGYFTPERSWATDQFGNLDPSRINLSNIFRSSDFSTVTLDERSNFYRLSDKATVESQLTTSPVNYLAGTPFGTDRAFVTRNSITRDTSSDEIVMFQISNLYYGDRIYPGSITIRDTDVSGSNSRISFTLKDDGLGSLYRSDSPNPAKWASVGNVFYDEGIIVIKSPHLYLFGQNSFEIDFKGERNIHTLTLNVPAPQGLINSSSNPAYLPVSASLDFNDSDPKFVYITGIQIHDDNLNVIMRANLAQPLKKRNTDEYLFKIKQDF